MWKIDVGKLCGLIAEEDRDPAELNHYMIHPLTQQELDDWGGTRDQPDVPPHPYTLVVMRAVVGECP